MLWLKQRDSKEHRQCETCKNVAYGQYYYWYSHPALGNIVDREPLVICSKCTRREAGKNYYKKLIEEKQL
tara:strand:+ start:18996 stop:19205 length:210 start_codon:yes stop_codon:yes gene_type:complete